MRARLLVLALAPAIVVASMSLAAPGPLGPELPAEDRPVPDDSWWTTCTDAAGVTSTIVPACVGEKCPETDDLFLERRDASGELLAPPLELNDTTAYRSLFRLSCHGSGWVVAQWRDIEEECYLHRLIDPDGVPVARLTLPPNSQLAYVRADHVALIVRDSLDVEQVQVFALEPGA